MLFSEKTCNELENLLTITAPIVALIITQDATLPNTDKINKTTKIVTQKKDRKTY